jgi:hypothetical protein
VVLQNSKIEERRKSHRYRLQVPVLFRWGQGVEYTEAGFTRDVSVKGLFVNSTATPPLNTRLQCQILMPASVSIAGNAIQAKGRVVRLANYGEGCGFAVISDFCTHAKGMEIGIQ